MNTIEARRRLAELTSETISIVMRLAAGGSISAADGVRMREVLAEARMIAYDAGYPGDAAWRALLRTSVYVSAPPTDVDREFWVDMLENLREGLAQLSHVTETGVEG